VFPIASWEKFLGAGFSNVWMTDSCPQTTSALESPEPFEVLSLAGPVSEMIRR